MGQKKLAEEILTEALNGTLKYGTAATVGLKEGYINFDENNKDYIANNREEVRAKMKAFIAGLKDGTIKWTLPQL
jgi:simple sugar transport system substrate-binding protein